MDIASFLIVIAIILLTAFFVAYPFLAPAAKSTRQPMAVHGEHDDHARSILLAEKEHVLAALQELDMDNELNKVPADEYSVQRQQLLSRGAEVLRQLDEQSALGSSDATVVNEDPLEKLIAVRRRTSKTNKPEQAGSFCPQCGSPVLARDVFCAKCGERL